MREVDNNTFSYQCSIESSARQSYIPLFRESAGLLIKEFTISTDRHKIVAEIENTKLCFLQQGLIMNELWKYFKCQQCGKCCDEIGLPYDPESCFNIAEFLKIPVEQVIEKYYGKLSADGSEWELNDNKRISCPFLKGTDDRCFCEIYSVRPEGCKLYPMETDGGRQGIDCPAWEIAISKLRKEQRKKYR